MLDTLANQFLTPCFVSIIASAAMQATIAFMVIVVFIIQGIFALAIHESSSKLRARNIELRFIKKPKAWAVLTLIFGVLIIMSYCLLHKQYFEDSKTKS